MRSLCVDAMRRPFSARAFLGFALVAFATIAMAIPEAEAARRRKARVAKAYSPPYASIVYDVNSGKVLQETHSNALRHPASVTKVMTLYMLFEQMERGKFRLDSELPVSAEAARQAPSKLGLKPGETISVEDAIKALVTKSANDASVVIAEAIGGSHERFAQMMTAKARSIGMSRSVFRNANGLPNPAQVTTARDLVTLGKAIQDRFPRQYTYFNTRNFEFNGSIYRNHNRLLGKVEGVDGIKTGYTVASGFNLLTSAKADGRHIIAVVLGGRSARARDVQVAALVENHMPRAYAGRRLTGRTVEVAAVDDDEDEKPAPRVNIAQAAPEARPSTLPLPPGRPRPAVIAEIGEKEQGLTRARPLALAASGSTGVVQSATTPLALVGTTPRSPAMRWVPSPQREDAPAPRQQAAAPRGEGRLVPPGSVRYTNSVSDAPVAQDEKQTLPKAADTALPAKDKVEQRLATTPPATQKVALAEPVLKAATPAPAKAAAPAPAKPVIDAKDTSPSTKAAASMRQQVAPPRSGWIIQLAAAESEGKARVILDSAKSKNNAVLKQAEAFTEAVTKGSSTLFRARFAGFDADEAQNACKALKRTGFNCFAQKI